MKRFCASIGLLLVLGSCSAGSHHPSDAAMERTLRDFRSRFKALVNEVQADVQLTSLDPNVIAFAGDRVDLRESTVTALEQLGMPKERRAHYLSELEQLGLYGLTKNGEIVELQVDAPSLTNGVSCKSYAYTIRPPPHIRASLDSYRIADEDKDGSGWSAYKHIDGNWYLHLVVLYS